MSSKQDDFEFEDKECSMCGCSLNPDDYEGNVGMVRGKFAEELFFVCENCVSKIQRIKTA